jgi:hypothetical protein
LWETFGTYTNRGVCPGHSRKHACCSQSCTSLTARPPYEPYALQVRRLGVRLPPLCACGSGLVLTPAGREGASGSASSAFDPSYTDRSVALRFPHGRNAGHQAPHTREMGASVAHLLRVELVAGLAALWFSEAGPCHPRIPSRLHMRVHPPTITACMARPCANTSQQVCAQLPALGAARSAPGAAEADAAQRGRAVRPLANLSGAGGACWAPRALVSLMVFQQQYGRVGSVSCWPGMPKLTRAGRQSSVL